MDDGWLAQLDLAKSDWTLGLVEAAYWLGIEKSVCNRFDNPPPHTYRERSAAWQHGAPAHVSLSINCAINRLSTPPPCVIVSVS